MTGELLKPGSRVAIAGAGCAGCSLACEILARCPGVHVSIFDPQQSPTRSRTWCGWEIGDHRFSSAISKRWDRVRIRSDDADITFDASAYPYACIRAEDFFRLAESALASPACDLRRGVSVVGIDERAGGVGVVLRTDKGESSESFDGVFDGRPPARPPDDPSEPLLLQHFGGIEIELSEPMPEPMPERMSETMSDTGTATLMDFTVSQDEGAHFMYGLPFTPHRILLESTFITPEVSSSVDYESNALAYASSTLGVSAPKIVYRESGVLPMTLRPLGPEPTRRVWPIGTRAGIGRASSGYAFDAIQRDSVRVVDALRAGLNRPRPPRAALLGMLDRVLLSLLVAESTSASVVFPKLFGRARPERLIRFLSDVPAPLDYLAVMLAMPKVMVIRHLLTHRSAWPRGAG